MRLMALQSTSASGAYVRALVEGHKPSSSREEASKARFLRELAHLVDPYDEHASPTHVTASGIVVGPRGTVLHLHKRLGIWMQPGGHIDPGESPELAARREATEELGLKVEHPSGGPRLIHLDVHDAAAGHLHLDLRYLLIGEDVDPDPPPGESPDARWYGWDEAIAGADPALVDALPVARAVYETVA
jgi:8-oxo-dGTP pyrophosphatase MutT (NUDIX family)